MVAYMRKRLRVREPALEGKHKITGWLSKQQASMTAVG